MGVLMGVPAPGIPLVPCSAMRWRGSHPIGGEGGQFMEWSCLLHSAQHGRVGGQHHCRSAGKCSADTSLFFCRTISPSPGPIEGRPSHCPPHHCTLDLTVRSMVKLLPATTAS